jgi:hypothetical protein
MSGHAAFRRQPVPGQMALQHATKTLPAPIRGIVENENWAYTKPGSAVILDNWFPTQKGLRLRGGTEKWLTLPAPVEPVLSGFTYVAGSLQRMFAATATRLFDITFSDSPALVTGTGTQGDGHYSAAQMATASGGNYLLAVNDAGDAVRRFNGASWASLDVSSAAPWVNSHAYAVNDIASDTSGATPVYYRCTSAHTSPGTGSFSAYRTANPGVWLTTSPDGASYITGPVTATPAVKMGEGLTHIWKHANRFFFIEGGTMNAWCLPVHAVGGELIYIPLSGAAKKGGSLLFGASWSIDSGSGTDDKCVFVTTEGEVIIFSGTDPTAAASWRQEGCYDISKPLSKYGHQKLGGDVLISCIDGIVPLTQVLQKDVASLSLAAITYNIEPMWQREYGSKRTYPWALAKWDEANMLLANFPGGTDIPTKSVAVGNLHTGAWCRFTNWDALCFMQMDGELFFGTQDGRIMQADSGGTDDGLNYVCTMVGGWEMFQVPPNQVTWFQARAAFFSTAHEPFEPQLAATVDYEFRIPLPPAPGPDPGLLEVWDQGLWDNARWDQPAASTAIQSIKNTMWVSIGETGFSHAPICQVNVEQQARPNVELVSISATFLRMGANV